MALSNGPRRRHAAQSSGAATGFFEGESGSGGCQFAGGVDRFGGKEGWIQQISVCVAPGRECDDGWSKVGRISSSGGGDSEECFSRGRRISQAILASG